MALPSYSTGTVSVAAGGTTVTGSGAIWTGGNAREGDDFVIAGVLARIVDVVSATQLTITPWTGPAAAGASYVIYQNASRRFDDVQIADDLRQQVQALNTEGFYHFVPPGATEPDPSLGDEGQYAFQATTGSLWVKSGGVWVSVGVYKGINPRGAWNSGASYAVNDVVSDIGNSYMATSPNTNDRPPSANWMTLGAAGAAATVTVGTVTSGNPGLPPSVSNSGTSNAAVLDFTIPRAPTVYVGTTTTGAPGSSAAVSDGDGTADVQLNFTIPAPRSYGGTSTTSVAIGTGSKTFVTQSGLAFVAGDRVHIGATGNELNWMEGFVTAYSGTSMTVAVGDIGGSGTFASWGIGLTGKPGLGDGDMKAANYAVEYAGHGPAVRANLGFSSTGEALAIAADATAARRAINIPGAFPGYISGLTLSNNSARPAYNIDIAAGSANDSTDTDRLTLLSALTKMADSPWAAGTGVGGRFHYALVDGTLHWYLIKNPTTGVVDVGFSDNPSSPTGGANYPSGFTLYRRIGSVPYISGALLAFLQDGDTFQISNPTSVGPTAPSTSASLIALPTVPTGIRVGVLLNLNLSIGDSASTTYAVIITDPLAPDVAPTSSNNDIVMQSVVGAAVRVPGKAVVMTNTSAQVRQRHLAVNPGVLSFIIIPRAWSDARGKK